MTWFSWRWRRRGGERGKELDISKSRTRFLYWLFMLAIKCSSWFLCPPFVRSLPENHRKAKEKKITTHPHTYTHEHTPAQKSSMRCMRMCVRPGIHVEHMGPHGKHFMWGETFRTKYYFRVNWPFSRILCKRFDSLSKSNEQGRGNVCRFNHRAREKQEEEVPASNSKWLPICIKFSCWNSFTWLFNYFFFSFHTNICYLLIQYGNSQAFLQYLWYLFNEKLLVIYECFYRIKWALCGKKMNEMERYYTRGLCTFNSIWEKRWNMKHPE